MGGRPRVHATRDQFELGYYRLNLTDAQFNDVADRLNLGKQDANIKTQLREGFLQPTDGQEITITYKGRYVRLKYQNGEVVSIKPDL
jgi:hypothetical protein